MKIAGERVNHSTTLTNDAFYGRAKMVSRVCGLGLYQVSAGCDRVESDHGHGESGSWMERVMEPGQSKILEEHEVRVKW